MPNVYIRVVYTFRERVSNFLFCLLHREALVCGTKVSRARRVLLFPWPPFYAATLITERNRVVKHTNKKTDEQLNSLPGWLPASHTRVPTLYFSLSAHRVCVYGPTLYSHSAAALAHMYLFMCLCLHLYLPSAATSHTPDNTPNPAPPTLN